MTAQLLADVPFAAVYASVLSRAFETGRAVAERYQIPLCPDKRLREIDAGRWQGHTYAELEATFPDSYGVWRRQIGLTVCPGGESVAQLQQRVNACVREIVRRHPDQTVCVATHATPIRVMECLWRGLPLAQMHTVPWVSNASITQVRYEPDGTGRIVQRDGHSHLGALHTVLPKYA